MLGMIGTAGCVRPGGSVGWQCAFHGLPLPLALMKTTVLRGRIEAAAMILE